MVRSNILSPREKCIKHVDFEEKLVPLNFVETVIIGPLGSFRSPPRNETTPEMKNTINLHMYCQY